MTVKIVIASDQLELLLLLVKNMLNFGSLKQL